MQIQSINGKDQSETILEPEHDGLYSFWISELSYCCDCSNIIFLTDIYGWGYRHHYTNHSTGHHSQGDNWTGTFGKRYQLNFSFVQPVWFCNMNHEKSFCKLKYFIAFCSFGVVIFDYLVMVYNYINYGNEGRDVIE